MIFHGASMSALGLRRDKAALSSGCKSHPSMQRYHLNQGYLRSGQPRVSHPIGPTIPHRNAEPAMLALLPAVSPRIFPRRSGLLISLSKTAPPKWGRIVLAGQSQGAGMAAFIAKRQAAARVILFSSPWDFVVSDGNARLAGYEDVNDAERLRHYPAIRWIVGGKAAHSDAASPSQMGRFETQWLAAPANLSALADLSGQWIELVHGRRPPRGIVLDMDSSVSPTHGEQEMSVWNGHYACACYHPLFVFNQFGDLERSALRPGNVHSADGWDGVLKPVVARYQSKVSRIYFRADAAFAMPDV